MATGVIETVEDQITCAICFEIFVKPKALPCLHTFCKKCISKFIIERRRSKNQGKKGYPCPICRRYVSVPAHVKHNPEVWADHLENNHMASSMIDAYKTPRGKSVVTCAEHPDKDLDFFCVDHVQFICSMCRHQHHRRCNNVTTRKEAYDDNEKVQKSTSNKSSKQKGLNQNMDILLEHCNSFEDVIDKRRTALELLENSEQHVRDEVVSMKKRITTLMNAYDNKSKYTSNEKTEASDQTFIKQSRMVTQLQNVKLPFQGNPLWITGIAILPSGKLLLVDNTNKAVTVFSITLDFLCRTSIDPAPYEVVSISSTQDHVMVSIPDAQELMKYDVLQDGSVDFSRTLKTNIACKAVASDDIYVAVCSNSELQIFETDGEVWMLVLDESYSTTKFTYITLTSSERKVFITDQIYSDPHVRCLDFDGATLWKAVDWQNTFCSGICAMDTELMVTTWDSGKMFTLSFNGDDLKTYNDSESVVAFPWKLHVSTRQKNIYIFQHKNTLSEEGKRTIKVFQMA